MFWVPEAQVVQYDDPGYQGGEIWSQYLSNIVIWAPGRQPTLEANVRKALASVDPSLVLYGVDPYSKILSNDFQQENMIATLTTLFGVLGLVLSAVGLYGVLSYMVERRTSEIGVRMALGATRSSVYAMTLAEAGAPVFAGLAAGLTVSLLAGRLIQTFLYGTEVVNIPVILAVIGLFLVAAAAASVVPARRAASVDPMDALRAE